MREHLLAARAAVNAVRLAEGHDDFFPICFTRSVNLGYRAPHMATQSLHTTLDSLAQSFTSAVLAAIRGASLQELVGDGAEAPRRGPGRPRASTTKTPSATARTSAPAPAPTRKPAGRLPRRSPEEIQKTLGSIVSLLKAKKSGLRSEQIRDTLKLDKRELPRVLGEGLKTKKLKSKGQKRATIYSAG
jgi:hypothetical protein